MMPVKVESILLPIECHILDSYVYVVEYEGKRT
jgi:hypothetical protein